MSEIAKIGNELKRVPGATYASLRSGSSHADWAIARNIARVAVRLSGTGLGRKEFELLCNEVIAASLGSGIRGKRKSVSVSGKLMAKIATKKYGLLAGAGNTYSRGDNADADFITRELERNEKPLSKEK